MNNNFPPPQRPRRLQQNPQSPPVFAPVNVIMGLLDQSKKRYQTVSEMIRKVDELVRLEDQGFRQLDLEASQMAQLMMQQSGEADPNLHRLGESLQAAKRAGALVRQNLGQARADLEGQVEVEKFLHGELMRWLRGQKPIQMPEPVNGNAPAIAPPPPVQHAQLAQGQAPAQRPQQPVPGQMLPQQPSYFTQTPYGPDPNAAQNAPLPQGGVPNHMFGPYPGQPIGPAYAPAPAVPESLPVTQLPVQRVPIDPHQMQVMPPPPQPQYYPSAEAARAAIPGPPPPVVQTPPVVQYQSAEAAKNVIDASHANNVPIASVPQVNANGQVQKPVS